MHRLLWIPHITKNTQLLRRQRNRIKAHEPCDVFINHRGVDTMRNIAAPLHHYLATHGLHPFLDNRSMNPGDKLLHRIEEAARGCRIGIAVFSPRYCESRSCLHELALLLAENKRVIPIFCGVEPSGLRVVLDNYSSDHHYSESDVARFRMALEEAANTVGLTFDSSTGDLSKLLKDALDAVYKIWWELELEECPALEESASAFY